MAGLECLRARFVLADRPGSLGALATAVAETGAHIERISVLERRRRVAVDDLLLEWPTVRPKGLLLRHDGHVVTATLDSPARLWVGRHPGLPWHWGEARRLASLARAATRLLAGYDNLVTSTRSRYSRGRSDSSWNPTESAIHSRMV